jgi:hypothetical protein
VVCERSVTNLIQRCEESVSLHLLDRPRLTGRLHAHGRVVLAIDGLQPDVGKTRSCGSSVIASRVRCCWRGHC